MITMDASSSTGVLQSNRTTATSSPLDLSDIRSTGNAKPATLDSLASVTSNSRALLGLSPSMTLSTPGQPPQPASALSTRRKSTKPSNIDADEQLHDTLMRELFNAIPPNRQPEHYNHKHTAIYAKRYIGFLRGRIGEFYKMTRLMGVTKESLLDMVRKLDNGVEVAEAMKGIEWDGAGPLCDFGREEAEHDEDTEMEDAEDEGRPKTCSSGADAMV